MIDFGRAWPSMDKMNGFFRGTVDNMIGFSRAWTT
jgi:hypothetical protein